MIISDESDHIDYEDGVETVEMSGQCREYMLPATQCYSRIKQWLFGSKCQINFSTKWICNGKQDKHVAVSLLFWTSHTKAVYWASPLTSFQTGLRVDRSKLADDRCV